MNATQYFGSLLLVNLLASAIALISIWLGFVTSHYRLLWLNIITSYITNTNLQHYVNQQIPFIIQTIGLTFLQFVAPSTGLSAVVATIRGIFFKKLGNFYSDFFISLLIFSLTSFVSSLIALLLGVPFGYPFSRLAGFLPSPLAYYNSITLLGNNGGAYFAQGVAAASSMPSAAVAYFYIVLLYLFPFSVVFLFGLVSRDLQNSTTMFIVVGLFYYLLMLLLLASTPLALKQNIASQMSTISALSLFYASIATNTGASVFPISALSPLQTSIFIVLMLSDSLPGTVGTGFISLLFIIIITIFFSSLMSGRMPKYLGFRLDTRDINLSVIGYIFHFALVLSAIPISLISVKGFSFSVGFNFTQLLWEVVSAAVNNGSDYYGFLGNTISLNLITSVLMVLGRYVPIYLALKLSESFSKKEPSFSMTDIRTNTPLFSLVLAFFIVLLVFISVLPFLALGPLSMR
ncbi:MAG: potassium-transporting ATPase subunit KdpA [Nitrososphaeria archaeon]